MSPSCSAHPDREFQTKDGAGGLEVRRSRPRQGRTSGQKAPWGLCGQHGSARSPWPTVPQTPEWAGRGGGQHW